MKTTIHERLMLGILAVATVAWLVFLAQLATLL